MRYVNKPGYFLVEDTRQIVAYRDLLLPGAEDSTVSIETLNTIAGVTIHSHPRLLCLCHPVEPIPMHFQRVHIGDEVVHFWDNAKNHLMHTSDCPRAKAADVARAKQNRQTQPGVEWENGEKQFDANCDPFAEDDQEREIKEVSTNIETSETKFSDVSPQKRQPSIHAMGGRRKSTFEGIIRAWYEIGRKYAIQATVTANGDRIFPQDLMLRNLVWGMWRVMLNGKKDSLSFTIGGKRASKFAYVPTKQARTMRKVGEQRILVGRIAKFRENETDIDVALEGINDVWAIVVPREIWPSHTVNLTHHLSVFRGVFDTQRQLRSHISLHIFFNIRSGSLGTLWCPCPLRTGRDSFESHGSSHPAVLTLSLAL